MLICLTTAEEILQIDFNCNFHNEFIRSNENQYEGHGNHDNYQ